MLGWTNTIRSGRPAFAASLLPMAYDLTEADLFTAVAQCRAILSGVNPRTLLHGRTIRPWPFARRPFSREVNGLKS